MPNQVWSATPDGYLDWFNEQVFTFSGLTYDELAGDGWTRMVHADDFASAAATWKQALLNGSLYQMEFRLKRHDDVYHWHLARAVPIKDELGNITRWVGTNTDIDDRKTAEAQQQILLLELQHRIKNTMTMVAAITKQSFRTTSSKKDAEIALLGRLHALDQAHDVLIEGNWSNGSIRTVVEKALAPHRSGEGRISVSGPSVELTPKRASSLMLSLHELATNATKYGALSVPTGEVGINWQVDEAACGKLLKFEWTETGGPAVVLPSKKGFGSRLIQATLAADFGGTVAIEYLPAGLRCGFEAKL